MDNQSPDLNSTSTSSTDAANKKETASLYKRELPEFLIAFRSTKGKAIFKEALEEGNMESYFELAEQYVTQARPEDCGLSTLVMILNALGIDPGRIWHYP